MHSNIETFGRGAPVVFLPGWGFSAQVLRPLAEQWATQHTCWLVDLPVWEAHDSLPPPEERLHQAADYIATLIPENATLVGWSLGGNIALSLAARHGAAQLLLLASNPHFAAAPDWPGVSLSEQTLFMRLAKHNMAKQLKRFIALIAAGAPLSVVQHVESHCLDPIHDATHLLTYLEALFASDLREAYQQISVPTRHILGVQDTLLPAHVSEHLLALNSTVVLDALEENGHCLPFTATHRVVQ